MFQKVGNWLTDKSDRFIRGEAGPPGSYYGSSEAEQVYGRMRNEPPEDVDDSQNPQGDTGRYKPLDPFDRAGKDYGGRVPYRSQRDLQAQQAALEAERQRQLREGRAQGYQTAQQPMQQTQTPYPPTAGAPPQNTQMPPAPAQGFGPRQGGYAQPQSAQANNVVMFPGTQPTPDGGTCTHMEYIVLLRSRNECKNVIEYIKANASVFLNMEFIASDSERQRCVDMLSGAAYTLGCHLNKISPRGIYLISAPSVYVVIDPAMQRFASGPEAQGFARPSFEVGYGARQQAGGYQGSPYARGMNEAEQQSTVRTAPVTPPSGYGQQNQNTQRTPPLTFGNVMAGNVTGSYPYVSSFQAGNANTGRYPKKEFQ